MDCFNHSETAAVGICKHCHKAICQSCCELVDTSVSCKNSCENQVRVLNSIVEKSARSLNTTESVYKRSSFFNSLIGLIFAIFGIYAWSKNGNIFSYFMIALGIAMIGFAISQYSSGKEYGKDKDV